MRSTVFSLATLCVLAFTGLMAQASQLNSKTFTWSAEFVALDESTRFLTVKAPVVGEHAPADFGRFKAGERMMLRWSGYDTSADAISTAIRPADVKTDERFTFPADFVAFDANRRYATFKVQIPENNVASLKALKPGEWVTATSPQGSSSKTTPIVSIRPYVISTSTGSSN
jgi:hypothetical protein